MRFFPGFLTGDLKEHYSEKGPLYDRGILVNLFLLLGLGLILIYSSSIYVATLRMHDSMFFATKQITFIVVGLMALGLVLFYPTKKLGQHTRTLGIFLIILVCLLPLIFGREINGAKRWISLGFMNFQPSELLKLVWIIYLGSYIQRHYHDLGTWFGFFKPLVFLVPIGLILIGQHDFGSLVVIMFITAGLMFIGGAGMKFFTMLLILSVLLVIGAIAIAPYRMQRLITFMDPWADPYHKGFQLTMGLMAFGRGGLEGQGFGNSIIKLSYIPEPHTDFIVSIWGEETGVIGVCLIIFLEFLLVAQSFILGLKSLNSKTNKNFEHGIIAIGVGLWLLSQTFINIGVASGLLPTKGLTLPFMSYGGSSLIVMMMSVAVLIRISYERRTEYLKMQSQGRRVERNMRRSHKHANEASEKDKNFSSEVVNVPGASKSSDA